MRFADSLRVNTLCLLCASIAVALLTIGFGCSDSPKPPSQKQSGPWSDVSLAKTSSKPLEWVRVDGLPDGVTSKDVYAEVRLKDVPFKTKKDEVLAPVLPNDNEKLALMVPFLYSSKAGSIEVVVTDGKHRSEPQPLDVKSFQVEKGAFETAVNKMDEGLMTVLGEMGYPRPVLRDAIDNDDISPRIAPLVMMFHIVSDRENPKSLVNRSLDEKTTKILDAFATRADLVGFADTALETAKGYELPNFGMKNLASGVSADGTPISIESPKELSDALEEFLELYTASKNLELAAEIVEVYTLVAGTALGGIGGVAANAAKIGLEILATVIDVSSMLGGAARIFYPCCVEEMKLTFNDTRLKEDAREPQLILEEVDVKARSEGINPAQVAAEWAAGKAAGEISGPVGDKFGGGAEFAVEKSITDPAVEKAANAVGGGRYVLEWNVTMMSRSEGIDGEKWLDITAESLTPRQPKMLAPEEFGKWYMTKKAYENPRAKVRVELKGDKFPTPEFFAHAVGAEEIQMVPITVTIEPSSKSLEKRGEIVKPPFKVKIARSANEQRELEPVEYTAGQIVKPLKNDHSLMDEFTWKSPDQKDKYPVRLKTEVKSEQGLRKRADNPPKRQAQATVYNSSFVDLPPVHCMEFGESIEIEAIVRPEEDKIEWEADAGSISVHSGTHSATYTAPSIEEGTDRITITNKDDDSIQDYVDVIVLETCKCTYELTIGRIGHVFGTVAGGAHNQLLVNETSGGWLGATVEHGNKVAFNYIPTGNFSPPIHPSSKGSGRGFVDFGKPSLQKAKFEIHDFVHMDVEWLSPVDVRVELGGVVSMWKDGEMEPKQVVFRGTVRPQVTRKSSATDVRTTKCE